MAASLPTPGRSPLRRMLRRLVRPLVPGAPEAPEPHGALAFDGGVLRQFERLSFVTRRRASGGQGGEHRSRLHAPSTDFVDYRPYQPGDDFRRVDWNVYGRLGTLQVRLTEARERLDVYLVLDCSSSMRWGTPDKLAYAAQLAAALGYIGLGRYDAVLVVCLGERGRAFGPLRGRARYHELATFLASAEPDGRMDLDEQLGGCLEARRGKRGQPLVLLISDLLASGNLERGVDALLRVGADVAVVHVVCPQEEEPEAWGEVELVDAESGEILEVGLSVEVVAQYRQRFGSWLAGLEDFYRGRGLRYARVRTDLPIERAVLDTLRQQQVLR